MNEQNVSELWSLFKEGMKDTINNETKANLKLFPAIVISAANQSKPIVRLIGAKDDSSQDMTIPNVSGSKLNNNDLVWIAYMYSLDNAFVFSTYTQMEGSSGSTGLVAGNNIEITSNGVINVLTAPAAEQDNTKPITSAAVFTEIGNIEAVLQLI